MSEDRAWQRRYWVREGLRRRGGSVTAADLCYLNPAPERPPSNAVCDLREAIARRKAAERDEAGHTREHVRGLVEREQTARWKSLVERFGSAVVETICRWTDSAFRLPSALRGIELRTPGTEKAEREEPV